MTPLSLEIISSRLRAWRFPQKIDGVIGIASGGTVPAALVAHHLGLDMKLIALNYRDESNEPRHPAPRLLGASPDFITCPWRRVLLVDDVWVTGKSWNAARVLLPASPALEVLPFVMKGKVDFALIRDIDGCVQWPWKVC